MNEQARRLKGWLSAVVMLRRASDALQEEFAQLANCDEAIGEDLVWEMVLERRAIGRELAQRGLRHRVLFDRCELSDDQRQVLQLRYVQGLSWSRIVERMNRPRGSLARIHDRALCKVYRKVVGR